jgi:hypothetical protein
MITLNSVLFITGVRIYAIISNWQNTQRGKIQY